jgi:predicted ATP-dependent serine protease
MVSNLDMRLKEAVKLGFKNLIIPKDAETLKSWQNIKKNLIDVNIHAISHIRDLGKFFSKR